MSIERINFNEKSPRNMEIAQRRKLERKLRGRVRTKLPASRFAPGTVIPEVPEGMALHKFYGEPVLLPAREGEEPLVGRTPYTMRQIEVLQRLVEQRNYELFIKPEEDAIKAYGIDSF